MRSTISLKGHKYEYLGVLIKGITLADLTFQGIYKYMIYQDRGEQTIALRQTDMGAKKYYPEGFSEEMIRDGLVLTCFKKVKCPKCKSKTSAILIGKSEQGRMCVYCCNRHRIKTIQADEDLQQKLI